MYRVRADREQFPEISLVAHPVLLEAGARPAVAHAQHRLGVVSLRRRHLGAVRDELHGGPVPATGHGAQVAVGAVPLERFAGRTGTGARVPPLGAGGRFIRVFTVDDDDGGFVVSP